MKVYETDDFQIERASAVSLGNFDSVHMVLETSVIYYYGINTETCEPEITELTYSQSEKCYQITDGQFIRPIEEFEKELAKEALYLKQNAQ